MSQNARLFAAAALMAVLSACGAKGPLFLPEKPVETQAAPIEPATPETPAPATDGAAPVEAPLPAEPPVDPATVPASTGNG
jgi:predicted small lipoprotein YifL